MKGARFAFALAVMSGVLFPALAAQDPLSEGAVLEYRTIFWGTQVRFLEIDGTQHNAMRPGKQGLGRVVRKEFPLAPGRHRVGFVVDESVPLHPQWVEFEAIAGKRYSVELKGASFRESESGVTSLFFNYLFPKISIQEGKKFVPHVSAATDIFTPQKDPAGNFLLYEDTSLPLEQTARIYCPRSGLIKGATVFFARIEGEAGPTKIDYRRGSDPWQLRMLPGKYRFCVTLEGGKWRVAQVTSGEKEMELQAEAGRTYRILLNTKPGDFKVSKDAIGNTQMKSSFFWEPYIEDVTGKGYTDQ